MAVESSPMTSERERLLHAVQEFDPSDAYHRDEYEEPGYYSALARVESLLRGEIDGWRDRKP
jgi:hypothetical protein